MVLDKELLKLAKYKLGVFDLSQPITDEELASIDELSINNLSFSGQVKNVDLTQLSQFIGLQRLDLTNFDIGETFAKAISGLQQLESLTISKGSLRAPIENESVEQIILKSCDVKDYGYLPSTEALDMYEQNVDISQMQNQIDKMKDFSLFGGSLKKSRRLTEMTKLENVYVVGAKIDDRSTIEALKNHGVRVEVDLEKRNIDTLFKA